MDDDVRKMLREFADRSVDGLPPADHDQDVARGKRMLQRIRRRRRVTGVLCAAAATAAVLAIGQAGWWRSGETEVATDRGGGVGKELSTAPIRTAPTGTASPGPESQSTLAQASPAGTGTMSHYSTTGLRLVTNPEPWRDIGCTLIPAGWTPQRPIETGQVVLTPPSVRTSAESGQLVLRKLSAPRQLEAEATVDQAGKVVEVGRLGTRRAGQVKVDSAWLLAELPVADEAWTTDHLRDFLLSCQVVN